ncbi:origin of replication complex subunit 3-like [Papaver somniferum]|nr:origin of replication complex subunit 3-like [Papaver somniferum]XP_026445984.1 origin of replication complex subunit 3-like [Papaver somniferum]
MESESLDSPPSSPIADNGENNLQPFFVLHKALPRKGSRKASETGKTRSKLASLSSPKAADKSEETKQVGEDDYDKVRLEAFDFIWSKIDRTIKDVLLNINISVFDVIHQWVCESFSSIKSAGTPGGLHSYPPLTDITCRQIFTGLVMTKNVEFVDDLLTFKELAMHLKSHDSHVVTLSSMDFTAKSGIGGCLRSLQRQLIKFTPDTADISILVSWYSEPENKGYPIVVIIDDMERCNGSVLSEFILILREWVIKIPVILIMGVGTTIDAPKKLLTSNALQYLSPCKFTLGSPSERMDAIMEALLVKLCTGFDIGHKVAVFLRNYFLRKDGTVTSFIRALKIACSKHFLMEPLSFLSEGFLSEDSHSFWMEMCELLPEEMHKCAFDLPSCKLIDDVSCMSTETLVSGLSAVKGLRKDWSSVVLCLFEAGKFHRINLFDIFCEALDPNHQSGTVEDRVKASSSGIFLHSEECFGQRKTGFISQAVRRIKDLPPAHLSQLLQIWRKHTEGITEINVKVDELLSMLDFDGESKSNKQDGIGSPRKPVSNGVIKSPRKGKIGSPRKVTSPGESKSPKKVRIGSPKKAASRSHLNTEKDKKAVNLKAVKLLECMVKDYQEPIESLPFHEIFCFKHVDILQSALIGDPRKMIQVDLLKSHTYLHCSCCNKSGESLLPSMNDTSIIYQLAQEHGDLINLHDWFQSFKAIILPPSNTKKGKRKLQMSPLRKKRKVAVEVESISEASIQARFCKAVTELQITGLLRMPSKRRPYFVQRIAFGF